MNIQNMRCLIYNDDLKHQRAYDIPKGEICIRVSGKAGNWQTKTFYICKDHAEDFFKQVEEAKKEFYEPKTNGTEERSEDFARRITSN